MYLSIKIFMRDAAGGRLRLAKLPSVLTRAFVIKFRAENEISREQMLCQLLFKMARISLALGNDREDKKTLPLSLGIVVIASNDISTSNENGIDS